MENDNRRGVPYLLVLLLLSVALAGGAAAGILGYIWITGGSGEASLSVGDALATLEASEDTMAAAVGTAIVDVSNTVIAEAVSASVAQAVEAGLAAAVPQAVDASLAAAVPEAVDASVAAAVAEAVDASMAALLAEDGAAVEFSIVAAESEARFTLEEDLRGVRTTVIGATNEVGGRIMVDLADPSASAIGTILINARTLETDNSFRNRALRSQILRSAQDEFEFISFEPRTLSNFSADTVVVGESISFDVSGDLTVAGATRAVTFNAAVTLDSETQISGSATVNLLHGDFGLVIPDVPSVANVTDDVDLTLEFVARAE